MSHLKISKLIKNVAISGDNTSYKCQ